MDRGTDRQTEEQLKSRKYGQSNQWTEEHIEKRNRRDRRKMYTETHRPRNIYTQIYRVTDEQWYISRDGQRK